RTVPRAAARRLLERTQDAAQLLEEQFDALLDLSRFDVGAIVADLRTFRVDQMLERLLDGLQGDADARGLAVERVLVPAVANSDPVLVARLLRNLLDNAVKYTKEGTIAVRMVSANDEVRIEVADTGPGIAEEDQSRIFEEYVQLGNPGRQRRLGVGLGLSIVSRIDRLLGLKLVLRSKPGEGASFSIALPAARMAEAPAETPRSSEVLEFRTSHDVWVVDDDPASLEAMRSQLAAWGASVATYDSAQPLLDDFAAARVKPDWLFCDDMLGGPLSGLEVALRLRERFGHSRICLFTGNTSRGRLEELRGSGFPVIVKPARAAAKSSSSGWAES
ncbi:hybrid sensor histidine kinase/response regulator, partial [bacterium]